MKWNEVCDNVVEDSGVPVGKHNFFKLMARAWDGGMIPSNVIKGFAATGIWPLNPKAVPEEAFLPSEVHQVDAATPDPAVAPAAAPTNITSIQAVAATTSPIEDATIPAIATVSGSIVSITPVAGPSSASSASVPLMDIDVLLPPGNSVVDLPITIENPTEVWDTSLLSILAEVAELESSVDNDDDILPPIPTVRSAPTKKTSNKNHYFVTTCDQAYQEKLHIQQEKEKKEALKEERKKKRLASKKK